MIKRGLGKRLMQATPETVGARFSAEFIENLNTHIKAAGYGDRGRSKWASEAIESLAKSWISSTPDDLILDLLTYEPQVANVNPTPFRLSVIATDNLNKLLDLVSASKRTLPDARTRLLYAALSRRLIRERSSTFNG